MITIKTLPQATAQEVFDQVATHLLEQGERSVEGSGAECRYRGDGGLRCAGGCLIADDEYNAGLEESSWSFLANEEDVPKNHANLIEKLQVVHDSKDPRRWLDELAYLGAKHGLNLDALPKEDDQ